MEHGGQNRGRSDKSLEDGYASLTTKPEVPGIGWLQLLGGQSRAEVASQMETAQKTKRGVGRRLEARKMPGAANYLRAGCA
jgi:hypothetical protein